LTKKDLQEITEKEFDDMVFATIKINKQERDAIALKSEQIIGLYSSKQHDKTREGYRIKYFYDGSGITYELTRKEIGF